jgi:hypothetical protein
MMGAATGAKAVLWGSNIVGFGLYRYEYASGRTGDWPIIVRRELLCGRRKKNSVD